MDNRPWDVFRIVNRPSGIGFALENSRNGHTNKGKLITQHFSYMFLSFGWLVGAWSGLGEAPSAPSSLTLRQP